MPLNTDKATLIMSHRPVSVTDNGKKSRIRWQGLLFDRTASNLSANVPERNGF